MSKENCRRYYQLHKEELKAKARKRYHEKKEIILGKHKAWVKKNHESVLKQKKKYYADNKDRIQRVHRAHYLKNKDKYQKQAKENYENNKDKIIKRMVNRRRTDEMYRIKSRLRTMLWMVMQKYINTGELINSRKYGIDWNSVVKHLGKCPGDMSKYHIDHIIPLNSFDLKYKTQVKQAFSPDNLQWLTAQENLSKGCKIGNY